MKILHINNNYAYTALFGWLKKKLDENGIKNQVYMPAYTDFESADEDVIISKCLKKWDRINFSKKQKKIYSDINEKVDMSEIDIVHAYILFSDGNIAYKLKKKYNIPYITHIQNTDINTFFKYMPHLRKRGLKIMLEASNIIFFTEVYRERVLKKYVPKKYRQQIIEKSRIIPAGIDDMWHENRSEKSCRPNTEALNIACVGAINKDKNILSVLKVTEKLNDSGVNCCVDIAGRPENKKIIEKIEKCPYAEYHGCISKEELIDIYRKNDLFILPSFHESFGLVYAEAMSQGLPIIYTKGEGFDGQFEEGSVGFSVNPYDYDEIIKRIMSITEDYERISRNCTENSKVFDWSRIALVYKQMYHDVLNITNKGDVEN